MKSPVISPSALLSGCASAIAPVLALVPLNATVLLAALAGAAGLMVVGFACGDYTRKPRFRLYSATRPAPTIEGTQERHPVEATADWTYQTVSA